MVVETEHFCNSFSDGNSKLLNHLLKYSLVFRHINLLYSNTCSYINLKQNPNHLYHNNWGMFLSFGGLSVLPFDVSLQLFVVLEVGCHYRLVIDTTSDRTSATCSTSNVM